MSNRANVVHRGKFKKRLKCNAPKILKTAGYIGMFAAPIFSSVSTYYAVRAVDRRKAELGVEKLPWKEIVKISAKYYIPPVVLMCLAGVSTFKGDEIQAKRTALLATACTAAEKTFTSYKEKVIEQIGEDAENKIEKEVIKEQVAEERKNPNFYIQNTGFGNALFREPTTGNMFVSSFEKVRSSLTDLTEQLQNEDIADLNDLFYLNRLRETDAGKLLGWSTEFCRSVKVKKFRGVDDDPEFPNGYWQIEYTVPPKELYIDRK